MIAPVNRREFITLFGGAAAWPLAAGAQQGNRVRRVGWLYPLDENASGAKSSLSAFTQALADLGWADGRNVRMDLRWAGTGINRIQAFAQELVGLQPDIILAQTTPATRRGEPSPGDRFRRPARARVWGCQSPLSRRVPRRRMPWARRITKVRFFQ